MLLIGATIAFVVLTTIILLMAFSISQCLGLAVLTFMIIAVMVKLTQYFHESEKGDED